MRDLKKGDYAAIIYKSGNEKKLMQGYVRYIDKRYLVLGMGFKDDWLNIERSDILEVRSNDSTDYSSSSDSDYTDTL